MPESDWLAEHFEQNRTRLRAVAYRMLGSLTEADDAVQEAWLRVSASDSSAIEDLSAWLTTIVARVCLNLLRSRKSRREEPIDAHVPDPIIGRLDDTNPEDEALLADQIGLALQVVLDTLAPAERLAFVLHDMFDLSFNEIATIVARSPVAARQLASRARRRVRRAVVRLPDPEIGGQNAVVDAFLAAARQGKLGALIAILDPDVVLRSDGGTARPDASVVLHGAGPVAGHGLRIHDPAAVIRPALVNGAAGLVITLEGRPVAVVGLTISGGRIEEINILADPERLDRLDFSFMS